MAYTSIETLYDLFINCGQKITTDTRKIEIGSIFFALKGGNFDANTFVKTAIEQGCAYAITDNEVYSNAETILLVNDVLEALQQLSKYHRSNLTIPVIGITGSNGKTTNKELIFAVLSQKYNVYATKGNLNNHIGVPLTLLSVTKQHEMAIIEMGANHQGEIKLLSSLADPDFGIITNIGKAHLEGFGGIDGIKKGKGELYLHIKNKNGTIFMNGNDEELIKMSAALQKVFYGKNEEFDTHGKLFSNSEYVEFKWNTKHKPIEGTALVKTKMFGHYNFINMLCAVSVGNYFNIEADKINKALSVYTPEMNRSQVLKTAGNTLILDAYNANPTSMNLAIANFMKQAYHAKLMILGDMLELGDHSKKEHETILKQALDLKSDDVWLVGELFFEFKNDYPAFKFFKNTEEAAIYIQKQPVINKTLLIKGSRGIKLEKLVIFL